MTDALSAVPSTTSTRTTGLDRRVGHLRSLRPGQVSAEPRLCRAASRSTGGCAVRPPPLLDRGSVELSRKGGLMCGCFSRISLLTVGSVGKCCKLKIEFVRWISQCLVHSCGHMWDIEAESFVLLDTAWYIERLGVGWCAPGLALRGDLARFGHGSFSHRHDVYVRSDSAVSIAVARIRDSVRGAKRIITRAGHQSSA